MVTKTATTMKLFTTHNDLSEKALLDHLQESNELGLLECDVLKVPHHGSDHAHRGGVETQPTPRE